MAKMDYKKFYSLLAKNGLISPIWEYVLSLVENEIKDREDKDVFLITTSIYFSLFRQIAEYKLPDLNCEDIEAAMRIVEGSANNMGVEVVD